MSELGAANLRALADLLDRVGDVVDRSAAHRELLAGVDPGKRRRCTVRKHALAGWWEPCPACRVDLAKRGIAPSSGAVPVRVRVVDAAAVAELVLLDLERRFVDELRYCPLPGREVSGAQRARRLLDVLPMTGNLGLLGRLIQETDFAIGVLTQAIDGEPSTRLPADCPHCGRRTLVVYHDQGVIRCERAGGQVCVCAAPDCPCHEGRRHEWWRARGKGMWGEWDMLARLLDQATAKARPA